MLINWISVSYCNFQGVYCQYCSLIFFNDLPLTSASVDTHCISHTYKLCTKYLYRFICGQSRQHDGYKNVMLINVLHTYLYHVIYNQYLIKKKNTEIYDIYLRTLGSSIIGRQYNYLKPSDDNIMLSSSFVVVIDISCRSVQRLRFVITAIYFIKYTVLCTLILISLK